MPAAETPADAPGDHSVLVAMDGSPHAERALEYVLVHFPASSVHVLYVVDPFEAAHEGALPPLLGYWGEWYDRAHRSADRLLERVRERANEVGVDVTTAVRDGRVSREVLDYVADREVDQIVIGPHSRGRLGRAFLGTTAERLVRRAPVPVTVVR